MNLQEARKKLPELQGLDDEAALDVIHQVYYPDWDKAALGQRLQYTPKTPPATAAGVMRTAGDIGIKLAQGGVDLGASVVGLGSLATGGLVGQGMRAIGYDPQRTKEALGDYLSESQQAAEAKVAQADGFVDTIATSLENPRAIMGAIAQSTPGMLAGMGVAGAAARGIATRAALTTTEGAAASARQLAAGKSAMEASRAALATPGGQAAAKRAVDAAGTRLLALSAATEGAQTAGHIADEAQAAGRAYSDYAVPALSAGALTGVIGYGAGRLMGDSATRIATGAPSTAVEGGLARRMGKEFVSEGILEEMPQSAQEQYFSNIAQGEEDRLKGVANAAGAGLVTGGIMGAGMGALQGQAQPVAPQLSTRAPIVLENSGPLSQAANAGSQALAQTSAGSGAVQAATRPYQGMDALLEAARGNDPALVRQMTQGQIAQQLDDGTWTGANALNLEQLLARQAQERMQAEQARQARQAQEAERQAQEAERQAQEAARQAAQAEQARRNAPQTEQEAQRISDDHILKWSEKMAPLSLRHAQALTEEGSKRGLNLYVVPHVAGNGYLVLPEHWLSSRDRQAYRSLREREPGSFSQVDELAQLAQAERADVEAQRQAIVDAQQAQALDAGLADVDARVQGAQEIQAVANRQRVLDEVLAQAAATGKTPAQLKRAFYRRLQQEGFTDTAPDAAEVAKIERFAAISSAFVGPLPDLFSAPNEWTDAVPERRAAPDTPKQVKQKVNKNVNTQAVDEAIAAGLRLRAAGGSVLHKKGSSKIFRINAGQKAYYLQKMQEMEAAPKQQGQQQAEHQDVQQPAPPALVQEAPPILDAGAKDGSPDVSAAPVLQADHDKENQPEAVNTELAVEMQQVRTLRELLHQGALEKAYHYAQMIGEPFRFSVGKNGIGNAYAEAIEVNLLHGLRGFIGRLVDSYQEQTPIWYVIDQHSGMHIGQMGKNWQAALTSAQQILQQITPEKVAQRVAALPAMDEAALAATWRQAHGIDAPAQEADREARTPADQGPQHREEPGADQLAQHTAAPTASKDAIDSAGDDLAQTVPDSAKRPLTRQELNRKTVKDMSDAELLQASTMFADGPRAPKIAKEIKLRGLSSGVTSGQGQVPAATIQDEPTTKQTGADQSARDIANAGIQQELARLQAQRQALEEVASETDDPVLAFNKNTLREQIERYQSALRNNLNGGALLAHNPELLEELQQKIAALADRVLALEAPDSARVYADIKSVVLGMTPLDSNLTRQWVDDFVARTEQRVLHMEKTAAKARGQDGKQAPVISSKTMALESKVLIQDYGVPAIDGYVRTQTFPQGVKDAFLRDGKTYLTAVAKLLQRQGLEQTRGRRGKAIQVIQVNRSGVGVAGDVSLSLALPHDGNGIHISFLERSDAGGKPALLMRVTTATDRYDGLQNMWPDTRMPAGELAKVAMQAIDDAVRARQQLAAKKRTAADNEKTVAPASPVTPSDHPQAESVSVPAVVTNAEHVTKQKEDDNEHIHHGIDGTGRGALAGVAAEQGRGIGRVRRVGGSTARRSSAGAAGGAGFDADPTLPGARSAGSGVADVHPAAAGENGSGRRIGRRDGGEGSALPDAGQNGRRDGSTLAAGGRRRVYGTPGATRAGAASRTARAASSPSDQLDQETSSAAQAPNLPLRNFQITDALGLGQGGEVSKFQDNLAAIRTLHLLQREQRRASIAEQAVLARFVGWGGLANAFANPESGQFKPAWEQRGQELLELLSKKDYAQARRSTLDAHYTAQNVVQAMWQAVQQLGFAGGLVLEPGVGSGNFIGLLPDHLRGNTRFIGIELDGTTANIASHLYPQETILHSGLQKVPLPDNAFDLAIGNPPFGEQSLRFQYKPQINGQSIHNQFFLAALDAVKPGGLLVQVVSRYLLDKQDQRARIMLSKKARLLGAIRLPDNAFRENARTEVVTDIVFLQRLSQAEQEKMENAYDLYEQRRRFEGLSEEERLAMLALIPDWIATTQVPDPLQGEAITVNRYFAEHPQMIMGVLERSGSMQYKNDVTVRLDNARDLSTMLGAAIAKLPHAVMRQEPDAIAQALVRHQSLSDSLRITLAGHENGAIFLTQDNTLEQIIERETPEGGFELSVRLLGPESPWSEHLFQEASGRWAMLELVVDDDGKAVKQVDDEGNPSRLNLYQRHVFANESDIPASKLLGKGRYTRLRKLVALRDLLKGQIAREVEDAPQALLDDQRLRLAHAYRAFIEAHGLINDPANAALVANMPDGALVLALEFGYRPAVSKAKAANSGEPVRPSSAKMAPILSKRVIVPYAPPSRAQSLADALSITLAEFGRVEMTRLAGLLEMSASQLEEQLRTDEKPLLFLDPESGIWEPRNVYLSGQVKRKLQAAREAGMSANVQALEAVQPESWTAENVTALLGSTWIPEEVYQDFIRDMAGVSAKVKFLPILNRYSVVAHGQSVAAKEEEWGAEGISIVEMIDNKLNNRTIRITYRDSDGKQHVDQERTELAIIKARAIAGEFSDWAFRDSTRRNKLVEIFNEKFNIRVNRQYDGSHLMLPGKVPDQVIAMRRHQKNAIWRGVFERFLLLDHAVGAGKTFTAIAIAMERRRMGLSKKPMVVVPNHMVEQFTADVYRLYPAAKVLAAGKNDFERSRRRRLFASIATGDADLIIVPHSSFGFIDIAPETEERYLEQDLAVALRAVTEAEEAAEENSTNDRGRKPFGVKEAERLVEKIINKLDQVKTRKDRLLTFEQMGIDYLVVDEAHEFKNLFYSSSLTGVKGMGNKIGSQKASDLYNKVRVLAESPTGAVAFMTGTPISNSAVEMYTMMRYLAATDLANLGLTHFDAWRAQFVSADPGWEPTETGRLQEVTRLGRTWSNMRSLMDLYYSFTDAVDNDAIKQAYREDNHGAPFPIPKVKGGERQAVVVPPTAAQMELLGDILRGFDGLPGIKDPYERNKTRLRLMDRARKVSLDVRVVEPGNESDEAGGKLAVVAQNVYRLYQKWNDDKGTQLIFLDRSVPKARGDDARLREYDKLLQAQQRALHSGDDKAMQRVNESLEGFDHQEMESLRLAQRGGWNAYQQIKNNLVALGIPAHEIRFVQEANNDEQKKALFDAFNEGNVRVLIGSTPRMGAGTNVQQRLVALHHVDVTWKPSDIEQREGRIVRQGNLLLEKYGIDQFEVEILAYATERTIDAKMWSLNAAKLKTINGIRKYDGAFVVEFEDEEAVSMAELAALASGDPLLLERVKLASDIDKLMIVKRQFTRRLHGIQQKIDDARHDIAHLPERIAQAKADSVMLRERMAELEQEYKARQVVVEGQTYHDHEAAQAAVTAAIHRQQGGNEKAKFTVQVGKRRLTSLQGAMTAVADALGDVQPFALTMAGTQYIARVDAARNIVMSVVAVADKLETDETEVMQIGSMLGFPLELSITHGKNRLYYMDMTLLHPDGSTLTSTSMAVRDNPHYTTALLREGLTHLWTSMLSLRGQFRIEQMEQRLQRAQESLPEWIEKGKIRFPQQEEMQAKQARLDEVIQQLAGRATTIQPLTQEAQQQADTHEKAAQNATSGNEVLPSKHTLSQHVHSLDSLLPALEHALRPYGRDFARNLLATGVLKLISQQQAMAILREDAQQSAQQNASDSMPVPVAFFHPAHNTSYLIADAISKTSSSQALRGLILHEVANHALHLGKAGPEFTQLLRQFGMMRKTNPKVQAAYDQAIAAGSSAANLSEEALGYYLEAHPDLSFSQKVVLWFRQAIRALGKILPLLQRAQWFAAIGRLSAEDLTDAAQRALRKVALSNQHQLQQEPPQAQQDVPQQAQKLPVAEDVLRQISELDAAFLYKKSDKTSLQGILADSLPPSVAAQVHVLADGHGYEVTFPDHTSAKLWVRPFVPGQAAYYGMMRDDAGIAHPLYQRPGKSPENAHGKDDVWIDISHLHEGSGYGALMYHVAANFAHNTGKVLIGDPNGLVHAALVRRAQHMLSSALKFGTTAHLAPSIGQVTGNAHTAIAPLDWKYGDHLGNIRKLMLVNLSNLDNYGGNGGITYDQTNGQFSDSDGTALTREDIGRLGQAGLGRAAQAAGNTLARHALISAVLRTLPEGRAERGAVPGLDALGRELRHHVSTVGGGSGELSKIFYSKAIAPHLQSVQDKISQIALPANYLLGDFFHQTSKESGKLSWWHKSIGTMHNLAQRHPAFAPVYASVQRFLGDVSRFATSAADLAPTLLPKLEHFADIFGQERKRPLTAQDVKAIAAPIFEGTLLWGRDENGVATKVAELEDRAKQLSTIEKAQKLIRQGVIQDGQNKVWAKMAQQSYADLIDTTYAKHLLQPGIVWTDAELRTLFGLQPAQIGMYREFRAAIDHSLIKLTLSEMLRQGGDDTQVLRGPVMACNNLIDAVHLIKEYFEEMIAHDPFQERPLMESLQLMMMTAERGMQLQLQGYAPLSRFGQYTVYVQEEGEQAYFGMFATRIEAAQMARRMRTAYPQAKVVQGTVSEEAYQLFAGISPETIELFGKMAALDQQFGEKGKEAYQTYLKLAKSNRSAMKRLIHRQGIAGFNEDAGRVLANFIYSNARLTAANLHLGELDEAITGIPQRQGQLTDAAMQLREHITHPQSGGTLGSGLLFAQYLGGSVASSIVNLTQPLTMTLPYLSQYGGVAKAAKRLMAAVRMAAKDSTGDGKLDQALKWAADKGIVAPQEVHYLRAQAAGKGALQSGDGTWLGDSLAKANNLLSTLSLAWGKPFAMAELLNRRITFIAAYNTAQEEGRSDPSSFAQDAVAQTQGVYNSGNKPRWARNVVGGLAMTFKQYAIAYVELLTRMAFAGQAGSPERAAGRRGALVMLAVLFLLSGTDGLPFEQDIEDAIDGLLQRMGYNFSSKRAKQAFLSEVLGDGGADFVLKGVSSLPGMPIDVSNRLGMGNLIPATGLLTKKASHTVDLGELAGPAGDLAKRSFSAAGKVVDGDVVDALFEVAPVSVRNARQGVDMLTTGQYHDTRGYKVAEVSPLESIMKIIGFQPGSIAQLQDAKGQALNMISQTRMRSSEIQEHWAQGIATADPDMIRQARAMRDDWNAKNPDTPIKADMPGIARRVRAMREDALARTQKTAPQALRQAVKRELGEVRQ